MARTNSANDALLPDNTVVDALFGLLKNLAVGVLGGIVISVGAITVLGTIAFLPTIIENVLGVVFGFSDLVRYISVVIGWGGTIVVLIALSALE